MPKKETENRVPGSSLDLGAENRAERLRQAVQATGGTAEAARRAGVPISTLGGYLAGGEMKLSTAAALAAATGVSLDWLASGRAAVHEMAMAAPSHSREGALPEAPGTVVIDRYDARAAAGKSGSFPDGRVIEQVRFNEEWVRVKLRRRPENLSILEAWGDSMTPTIGDGDVLMIDRSVTDVVSGRLYVLNLDGELLVKRLQRLRNGTILLISDNERYRTEEVEPSETAALHLVGEVVWSGRII